MRHLALVAAGAAVILPAAALVAQPAGPATLFTLPTSTGPFIPKGPHPLAKPRVDCGRGVYVEGTRITVNGKGGWRFVCPTD